MVNKRINMEQLKRIKGLINKKFNKLKIISFVEKDHKSRLIFKCLCDCGNHNQIPEFAITSGHTKSCGCLQKEMVSRTNSTHRMTETPFYTSWMNLKARCNNPNNSRYNNYGGRGITYDPRWDDFLEFKKDMYFKYVYAVKHLKIKKPSIERKDVNGDYCKGNCEFIPMSEQGKNKVNNKTFKAISPNGVEYTHNNRMVFSRKHNLCFSHVSSCLRGIRKQHKGWVFILT